MTNHISDERLAALKAGLEGVTPGPWEPGTAAGGKTHIYGYRGRTICLFSWQKWEEGKTVRDVTHIANCDPDTIASLIARLEAAEARQEIATKTIEGDG